MEFCAPLLQFSQQLATKSSITDNLRVHEGAVAPFCADAIVTTHRASLARQFLPAPTHPPDTLTPTANEVGGNGGDGDDDSDTNSDGVDDASEASGDMVSHAPRLPVIWFQAQKRSTAKVYKRGSSKRRTVEKKFHHVLPDLLCLCHVADPCDLTAI